MNQALHNRVSYKKFGQGGKQSKARGVGPLQDAFLTVFCYSLLHDYLSIQDDFDNAIEGPEFQNFFLHLSQDLLQEFLIL